LRHFCSLLYFLNKFNDQKESVVKNLLASIVAIFLGISTVNLNSSRVIHTITRNNSHTDAQWAVVGAGPAGIATVGLLLDLGTPANQIYWIDPEFNVGRMGQFYTTVPGNAKAQSYIGFIQACNAFCDCYSPAITILMNHDPHIECDLGVIVAPLQDITNHLLTKVHGLRKRLTSLDFEEDAWRVGTGDESFTAQRVVLATGAHPRTFAYECKNELPLDYALNKNWLANQVTSQDTVAVVGSSHSAILLLKYLSDLPAARVMNFYLKPLMYAVDTSTWLPNGQDGLSGMTAEWAFNVLTNDQPGKIIRLKNTQEAREAWLPISTKIIYAAGYDRNELPLLNGTEKITYDSHSGVIAPHLFGIGIAFPEEGFDAAGNKEHRVGLKAFMEYAQQVIPEWQHKNNVALLKEFEDLFIIEQL